MKNTRLIMVGGFLGAGKTTLLFELTKRFLEDGQRVGLVTNDQASELVDTAFLLQSHVSVAEVSGSCFCCNFDGFLNSLRKVKTEAKADIVIVEPVGSCADLSATLIQPIKQLLFDELTISPLTVLADPTRLKDIINGGNAGLHPSAAYIYQKQLEESDILLITKTDLLSKNELEDLITKTQLYYPETEVLPISSKTGEGIDIWLDRIYESKFSGLKIVNIDYDKYAEGEAVLGWLNSKISLHGNQIYWDNFAYEFLLQLSERIDSLGINVGHIKIMLENESHYLVGNLTGKKETLSIRGSVGISNDAELIINARVGLDPKFLEQIVKETLDIVTDNAISLYTVSWQCLKPGYPNPTYRYNKIVV